MLTNLSSFQYTAAVEKLAVLKCEQLDGAFRINYSQLQSLGASLDTCALALQQEKFKSWN